MKKVLFSAFAGILCFFFSCSVAPEPINYGQDACHFCKMTIVDQQHSAQYVTKKGKQFKFDAIECMVNELSEKGIDEIAFLLVADYHDPGQMTPAFEATYLISKEIKSPMGADLTGFASEQQALESQKENGGKLYSWKELLEKFDVE
jgi:copper chaperone NosL